jgi:hypothetical protein
MLQVMSRCRECSGVKYFGAVGDDVWKYTPEPVLYRSSAEFSSPIFRGDATDDDHLRVLMEKMNTVTWMSEDPLAENTYEYTVRGAHRRLYPKKVKTVGGNVVDSNVWGLSPVRPGDVDTCASPCKCVVTPPPPEVQDLNRRLNGFQNKLGRRECIDLSNYNASPRWQINGWRSPQEAGEYSDVSEAESAKIRDHSDNYIPRDDSVVEHVDNPDTIQIQSSPEEVVVLNSSDSSLVSGSPDCYITKTNTSTPVSYASERRTSTPKCHAYDPANQSGSVMWGLKEEWSPEKVQVVEVGYLEGDEDTLEEGGEFMSLTSCPLESVGMEHEMLQREVEDEAKSGDSQATISYSCENLSPPKTKEEKKQCTCEVCCLWNKGFFRSIIEREEKGNRSEEMAGQNDIHVIQSSPEGEKEHFSISSSMSEEAAGKNDIHEMVPSQSSSEEGGEQSNISGSWQIPSSPKETVEHTAMSSNSDKSMAKVQNGNNDLGEEQMDVQGIEVEIETEREAERETVRDDETEMDQGKDGINDEGYMRVTDDEGQDDGDYDEAMKRAYDVGERANDADEASNDLSEEDTCQNEWSGATANVYMVPDYVGEREFPENIVIGTNTRVFVLMAGVLWPTRVIIQDQQQL